MKIIFLLTPNLEYFTPTFCLWLQYFAKSQQNKTFSHKYHFYSSFKNPSENSVRNTILKMQLKIQAASEFQAVQVCTFKTGKSAIPKNALCIKHFFYYFSESWGKFLHNNLLMEMGPWFIVSSVEQTRRVFHYLAIIKG